MVNRIVSLEATNVALLAEKMQAEKVMQDVKKDWKKEEETWHKTQGEAQEEWAAHRKALSDNMNDIDTNLKIL